MMARAALVLFALLAVPRVAWGAEPLVADLTSHLIGITTGFTGTSMVLFGATDGPGDIVGSVRGPERDLVVRRKSRIAGIWVNTSESTFPNTPSFYSLATNRPLDQIASASVRALHQIGLDNMRIAAKEKLPPEEASAFRAALIRTQQRDGLFAREPGKVTFLGDRLFRTSFSFPSNVPTGTYLVEVYLLRDGNVVSGQTIPLDVSQVGIGAEVYDFATRWALLYGIIAVIAAAMAGWLASLPFRRA